MLTRVIAVRTKLGKARELVELIQEKVWPRLEQQRGFMDAILLVSDTDLDQVLAISVWESKSAAEQYLREHSAGIGGLLFIWLRARRCAEPSTSRVLVPAGPPDAGRS